MMPRTSRRFPAPGWLAGPALPVAGGRGVEETAGTFPAGVLSGLAVALAGVGEASPRVGAGVPVVTESPMLLAMSPAKRLGWSREPLWARSSELPSLQEVS